MATPTAELDAPHKQDDVKEDKSSDTALEELEEELSRHTPATRQAIPLKEEKSESPSPTVELEKILGLETVDMATTGRDPENDSPVKVHTNPTHKAEQTPTTEKKDGDELQLLVAKEVTESPLSKERKDTKRKRKPSILQVAVRTHIERHKLEKAIRIQPLAVTTLLRGYYRAEKRHCRAMAKAYRGFANEMSDVDKNHQKTQEMTALLRDILDMKSDEEVDRMFKRFSLEQRKKIGFSIPESLTTVEEDESRLNLKILRPESSTSVTRVVQIKPPVVSQSHAKKE